MGQYLAVRRSRTAVFVVAVAVHLLRMATINIVGASIAAAMLTVAMLLLTIGLVLNLALMAYEWASR